MSENISRSPYSFTVLVSFSLVFVPGPSLSIIFGLFEAGLSPLEVSSFFRETLSSGSHSSTRIQLSPSSFAMIRFDAWLEVVGLWNFSFDEF